MPASRNPRRAANRVDMLANDMRKLSTNSTTKATHRERKTDNAEVPQARATRARVKRDSLVLVEATDAINRRRRQKKVDTTRISGSENVFGGTKVTNEPTPTKTLSSPQPIVVKPTTVKTSFLLVSDTHDVQPTSAAYKDAPFRYPFPKTDVFIHAGDMTQQGRLSALKTAISWIESIPAKLKIIIAGNHDHSLDSTLKEDSSDSDSDSTSDRKRQRRRRIEMCRRFLKSEEMKAKGIHYLENALETFELNNGATLTVFASPYTPRGPPPHHGGAFRYNQDFNPWNQLYNMHNLERKEVDVTVVHGPAYGILDRTAGGENVGCRHLREFLNKVRPLMSVCGHIHEAAGVNVLEWEGGDDAGQGVDVPRAEEDGTVFTDARGATKGVVRGERTVFVNASLVGAASSSYAGAARYPYVIELELPVAAASE
ncbi:hypothetical protein TWF281_008531 [Arthrobotrys megalospora]